jgi:hypothetical protein
MSKPASIPTWSTTTNYSAGTHDTGTATKVNPGAVANEGHRRGVAPLSQHQNYWQNLVGAWCTWLNTDVICADGGSFAFAAMFTVTGGELRFNNAATLTVLGTLDADDAGAVVNLGGTCTFTATANVAVVSAAAWEFANVPLFSAGATFNDDVIVKNASAQNMLHVDSDDSEIRFTNSSVQFASGFLGTAGIFDFGPTVTRVAIRGTQLSFESSGSITGVAALTGSIIPTTAGFVGRRVIAGANGNTSYTITNGDVIIAPVQSAPSTYTLTAPAADCEITVHAGAITSGVNVLTVADTTGNLCVLSNSTPGTTYAWADLVYRAATGRWSVLRIGSL